jgi:dihydropteroate synthase
MAVPAPVWTFRDRALDLSTPRILGVLNVTPDSFADGGLYLDPAAAVGQAERLVADGADLIDLGGESTRPGADPVSADEEIRRILPVIGPVLALGIPVSIDTGKAEVARVALDAGAHVVNDVTALEDPGMARVVAEREAGLVLMHRKGTPRTMQRDPRYEDVVMEVRALLASRRAAAVEAGIAPERIVLDPGIGFGKAVEHNLELIRRVDAIASLGSPVLLGVSRKRFLGALTGVDTPTERDFATVAAVVAARMRGVALFRVHHVAATRQALRVADAIARPDPVPA